MGEWGICCGKVALSQCTSLCGMPQDGEGYSWTLHRNYLLPINSNIGQDEKDAPMAGVNTSTPAPPVASEPADAGSSGMVTPSTAGNTPQGSLDQPAPLRCDTWKTQKWLPWRNQNFSLQAGTRPSDIWDAWTGLHAISSLYNTFWGSTVWGTLYCYHQMSAKHHPFWHLGEFPQCSPYVDFGMVGKWTKGYLAWVQLPH